MISGADFELQPIGFVDSTLEALEDAPPQADEGGREAWLVLDIKPVLSRVEER